MTVAPRPLLGRRLRSLQLGTALATTLFAGGAPLPAFAQDVLPTGGSVVEGAATFGPGAVTSAGGASLDVDLHDSNSVITWTTYSVGADNRVSYVTPSTVAQYAVLNRVLGGNVSQIDGSVVSQNNIVVWLSNPNGILVGPTGSFNTRQSSDAAH